MYGVEFSITKKKAFPVNEYRQEYNYDIDTLDIGGSAMRSEFTRVASGKYSEACSFAALMLG